MRMLLMCAAGALALSACQREPATEAPIEPPADTAPSAGSTADSSGSPASGGAPASRSNNGGAMAAGDAGSDTAGAAPTNDGGMMSGPSQATRDAAKEKAEQTNLHPAG